MKRTLVLGASPKSERYANIATHMLQEYGHAVIPFAKRKGECAGIPIETVWNAEWEIDTVTLYIIPTFQEEYKQAIMGLHPKRVIFNPGTENTEFQRQLISLGIDAIEACTLVLLRTGQY
jgi:predicted CoA-binding protein